MPTRPKLIAAGALISAMLAATTSVAQNGAETLGGQPPPGATASVKDFDYQIKYQRAFEAVLWNMPAVAIDSFRRAAFNDLGAKDNDIIAYSGTATPKLEAITANSTTPYITAFTDLKKGPVVLEVPAPVAGVLQEIRITAGTTVKSGELLAVITPGAASAPGPRA